MRTVKSLREALAHFPDDALCYAYEGEERGVVVARFGIIIATETPEAERTSQLRDNDGQRYVIADDELADHIASLVNSPDAHAASAAE